MSEEIRALIFIMGIVTVPLAIIFQFSKYCSFKNDVRTWIIAWIVFTVLAFLSPNFWIYALLISIFLLAITKNNVVLKICLFFVLLPSFPSATAQIPGFGAFNYLFNINMVHVLVLTLLAPIALKKSSARMPNKSVTMLMLTYFAIVASVHMRDSTFTDTLRNAFIVCLGMLIPFFAFHKSINDLESLKKILFAMIFGILLQAFIGLAETMKAWQLYNSAVISLGLDWGFGGYLRRVSLLRASGALGHSIILGYVATIGMGLLLYFYPSRGARARQLFWALILIFAGGLIATLSRGPWVGAAIMIICFILTGKKVFGNVTKLGLISLIAISVMTLFPFGQQFVDLIPFLNTTTETEMSGTVSYRERLMEQSWIVIQRNPFFGSANYLATPEMESMRQGQGIIDIVNTYLRIALETGFFGLGIFVFIFVLVLGKLRQALAKFKQLKIFSEHVLMARVLLSTIIGIMVMIFTVSSIGVISIYYWSAIGIACAFLKISKTDLIKHYIAKRKA